MAHSFPTRRSSDLFQPPSVGNCSSRALRAIHPQHGDCKSPARVLGHKSRQLADRGFSPGGGLVRVGLVGEEFFAGELAVFIFVAGVERGVAVLFTAFLRRRFGAGVSPPRAVSCGWASGGAKAAERGLEVIHADEQDEMRFASARPPERRTGSHQN